MDHLQQPSQKLPEAHFPGWYERILLWSGWESLVEYRRQLLGVVLCLALFIFCIGWWFAKNESSSIGSTLRAEAIVQRLQSPESTPETSKTAADIDLQRLNELASKGSSLSSRFSGVIAEEDLIQHVEPLSSERFAIASKNLTLATLDLHSELVESTLFSQQGRIDDALRVLDNVIAKSLTQESTPLFPELHAYALLQKATLLCEQKKSNSAVVDELQQFLDSHPSVETSFDSWLSGKGRQALISIRLE